MTATDGSIEVPGNGFQENVADISTRACQYFERSVGLAVTVAPETHTAETGDGQDSVRGLALLRAADWLFAGPGSPTYALRCWRDRPVGQALQDRLRSMAAMTVFASAAAATLGGWSVPVYEVYKVGAPPHWLDGLDLLRHHPSWPSARTSEPATTTQPPTPSATP